MDYTICKNVIKNAKDGNRIMTDLLMPFTASSNPHKVILNEKINNEYSNYESELIRSWLNLLSISKFFKNIQCTDENIFIATCRLSHDKRFIVHEKEDYPKKHYKEINVLDSLEAIEEISPVKVQIVQQGSGNQASMGNNSANIKK